MAIDQLSPSLLSPPGNSSPGSSPELEANHFELQQEPAIRAPNPLWPPTSLWHPTDSDGPYYSPLPPTGSCGSVRTRKSIVPISSRLVESLHSRTSSGSISISDSQYLGRRPDDGFSSTWGIHWWTPVSMIGLYLLGLVGAIVHHAYYKSLDGHEARDQLNKVRYGTAMAVFAKTAMVGSVVIAYRQRIWWTFRRKAMTVNAIDSMFAVIDDPTMFYQKDMVSNAKLETLMAVAVWLIPLAAVLSPASLLSNVVAVTISTTCPSVASLNFSVESHKQFGKPIKINGYNGVALSYWNTTGTNATEPGWFAYWDRPSKNADRIAALSRYSGRPVAREDASLNSCGDGWNCTYYISFTGPGYKCTQVASGVDSNTTELADRGAPFDTSTLVPVGNRTYEAVVDIGEYNNPQTPSEDGHPIMKPLPEDLGVFKTEPVIWVGYTVNITDRYRPDSPYAKWGNVMIPKIFVCEHYETRYAVFFNFSGGQQFTNVTERTFLAPIINTRLEQFPNRTLDPSNILPTQNFQRPNTDVPRYKLTATYHSLGLLFRSTLRGTAEWDWSQGGNTVTHSDVTDTRLFDQHIVTPVPDFQTKIQSFYEDFLLSLLSNPLLLIATNLSVPCTKTRNANLFRYNAGGLWPGYAIMIVVCFACLFIGLTSMHQNGVDSDVWFSRIMATTRNRTLDRLCVGACLGGGSLSKELGETRLMFGELKVEDGGGDGGVGVLWGERVAHCGFGTVEQTEPIVRRRVYAGLRMGGGEYGGERGTEHGP